MLCVNFLHAMCSFLHVHIIVWLYLLLFSAMNLYWIDAKMEMIARINIDTGTKDMVYSEARAHFFGVTLLDGYLYVTDWFRK